MSLRVKSLPAGITFAAKASLPISESRFRFVHFSIVEKVCSSCIKALSLSWGRLIVCVMVSTSTPRKVILVVGGVRFSSLVATPSRLHKDSIPVKVVEQVVVSAGPAIRKSSK